MVTLGECVGVLKGPTVEVSEVVVVRLVVVEELVIALAVREHIVDVLLEVVADTISLEGGSLRVVARAVEEQELVFAFAWVA